MNLLLARPCAHLVTFGRTADDILFGSDYRVSFHPVADAANE
jgi:hypothetical protein